MPQKDAIKRINRYKKVLIFIINEVLPNCKIYLFGSRARQKHAEGADIDLALDNGKPIDTGIMYKIQDKIEESTIPIFVDLVDINNADETIKKEIEGDKVIWKK